MSTYGAKVCAGQDAAAEPATVTATVAVAVPPLPSLTV
jgi:hypothetical protein